MASRSTSPFVLGAAALGSAVLCAACSGGFFPSPIATDPAPESSATGPRPEFLTLGKMRWSRGNETVLLLREDGTLEENGSPLGKLRSDGVFTASDGKRVLTMQPNGFVHVKTGFDIEIDADGTSITHVHGQPDESLTLAQVSKPRSGLPPLAIEGVSPKRLRTAMWILTIPDLLRVLSEEDQ